MLGEDGEVIGLPREPGLAVFFIRPRGPSSQLQPQCVSAGARAPRFKNDFPLQVLFFVFVARCGRYPLARWGAWVTGHFERGGESEQNRPDLCQREGAAGDPFGVACFALLVVGRGGRTKKLCMSGGGQVEDQGFERALSRVFCFAVWSRLDGSRSLDVLVVFVLGASTLQEKQAGKRDSARVLLVPALFMGLAWLPSGAACCPDCFRLML